MHPFNGADLWSERTRLSKKNGIRLPIQVPCPRKDRLLPSANGGTLLPFSAPFMAVLETHMNLFSHPNWPNSLYGQSGLSRLLHEEMSDAL